MKKTPCVKSHFGVRTRQSRAIREVRSMKSPKPKKEQPQTPSLPERIRSELNVEKWSIWQPANARSGLLKERAFEREIELPSGNRVTAKLTVSPTTKGNPTTKDQRVYYALVKCGPTTHRSLFSDSGSFSGRHSRADNASHRSVSVATASRGRPSRPSGSEPRRIVGQRRAPSPPRKPLFPGSARTREDRGPAWNGTSA